MNKKLTIKSVIAFGVLGILSACATTAPVSRDSRDQSGLYDGEWVVNILPISGDQRRGRWIYTCDHQGSQFKMTVQNATISIKGTPETFVNASGFFKIVVPTKTVYTEGPGSDATLLNDPIIVYMSGNLSEGSRKGKWIRGSKRMGERGCQARVEFRRMSNATPVPPANALQQ